MLPPKFAQLFPTALIQQTAQVLQILFSELRTLDKMRQQRLE
jgi:hypothetical protein